MAKSHRKPAVSKALAPSHERRAALRGERSLSRQERFCRNVVWHEMALVMAYCEAFEWTGSKKKALHAVRSLMDLPEVQHRMRELRSQKLPMPNGGRSMLTLEEHLEELGLIEREAMLAGQFGPAATLAIARGKVSGLYVERSVHANVSLEDLIAASRRQLGKPEPVRRITSGLRAQSERIGSKTPPLLGPLPDDA